MDIRKFFGGGTAARKPSESKKEGIESKTKGSSSKQAGEAKTEVKTKKPDGKKTQKSSASKSSSKQRDDSPEDNIVINDSSDEDVIESSFTSSPPRNKTYSKSKDKKEGSVGKKGSNKEKEQPKDYKSSTKPTNKKLEAKEETDINKNSKSKTDKTKETIKDEKKSRNKSSTSDSNVKEDSKSNSQTSERRQSPRKANSVTKQESSVTKSKRKPQTVVSDSDDDVDIVEASSEEESPVAKNRKKGKAAAPKRKSRIFESDSDEEPLPKGKPKAKKKKNGSHVIPDSDEEKIETALDKFVRHDSTPAQSKEKKKEVKKSTPVSITDFFGGGSVSATRKERPTVQPAKRKLEDKTDKEEATVEEMLFDDELHDDEDFLKTLDELDGPDVKKVKLSDEKSPKKDAGGSLASKLADKVRANRDASVESPPKKHNGASSPIKKPVSPTKSPPVTVKKGKTYTMEVTKTNPGKGKKEVGDTKVEVTPPKADKPTPSSSKKTSAKKDSDDKEDDGFGLKTSSSFRAFKMRGGPLALGTKEVPEGEENCLEGLTFVITGVLDSIERDDAKSLVEKLGGRVTGSVSKKTSHVVVGREPGESKIKKAQELKVNTLDEDGLFDLIRNLPGKTSKYEINAKEQLKKEESIKAEEKAKALATSKKLEAFHLDKGKGKEKDKGKTEFTQIKNVEITPKEDKASSSGLPPTKSKICDDTSRHAETLLWVDKHKPTSLKQIIGQHGDKSNANKLLHWMRKWHDNIIVKGLKPAGNNFFGGKGDGAGFRAALLSGPPGIGKTTTATLVCKEVGFSYVELNASDTRSKKSLKEVVSESLTNQTLVDYMGNAKGEVQGQSHCLIMDEVDGMSGNQDRGGLQEVVQLIKTSKIPIICICNDRNSMKMRTLANYCFDLRFSRPRVEQIKGAMMTLAFREGLTISAASVQEIIQASNHDIRQVIHNLSMMSAGNKEASYEQVKAEARKAKKDMKLGPFDVCRKVFVVDDETSKMTFSDKSDLFFHDYSFGPLFVHENYPHVIPVAAKDDKTRHMACLARTIDSLCDGDLVEKCIRKDGNWNLLPVQAMYSSVIPGEYMRGRFPQMTDFPSWLGKNSSKGKTERILSELNKHMHLQVSCDKRGLALDYLPAMRVRLAHPLLEQGSEGVPAVIGMMDDYDIVKEDFDNIMEVTKWPHSADPMAKLESKTKAAFTRQYNKGSHMTPYSTGATGKKKRGRGPAVDDGEGELLVEPDGEEMAVVEESEEEDDEPAVVAKPKAKGKQAADKGKGQGSRGGKGGKGRK